MIRCLFCNSELKQRHNESKTFIAECKQCDIVWFVNYSKIYHKENSFVLNYYNGKDRSCKNVSGGEKFGKTL